MKYLVLTILLLLFMVTAKPQSDSLFVNTEATGPTESDNQVELGMVFKSTVAGKITHIKFYKPVAADAAVYTINLWTMAGTKLVGQTYTANGKSGWQRVPLITPFKITPNTNYVVSYHCKSGKYYSKINVFTADRIRGNLTAPASSKVSGNGRYQYSNSTRFPNSTYASATYFVDVVFEKEESVPPVITQPLIVNAGKDSLLKYPQDSIQLNGVVTGDGATWKWTMLGDSTWSSTELKPWIKNMRLWNYDFILTGKDSRGTTSTHTVNIRVQRPVAIILSDGTWIMPEGGIMVDPLPIIIDDEK